MTMKKKILYSVFTGLLLGLSFPPIEFGFLPFIAFITLLYVVGQSESKWEVFKYSYLAFLVMNLLTIYWISGWWGDDPWLKVAGVAVNLVNPLLFTVPMIFLYALKKRVGMKTSLLSFPFIWVSFEWIAHLPELSFPWHLLANTQTYRIEAIQFIEYTGAFGLSFHIALVNAFIARHLMVNGLFSRQNLKMLGVLLAIVFIPVIYGAVIIHSADENNNSMRIGIAQPDIDPYAKWSEGESPLDKVRNLMSLYDTIVEKSKPDLVLFPETAFPFLLLQPSYAQEYELLKSNVDSAGVPLLTGFADIRWYEADPPASARKVKDGEFWYQTFNSSLLIEPWSSVRQVYHKSKLTPLAERIPYLDAMPFLQDVLTWGVGISNWGLGNDTTVFQLDRGPRIWAMICYETLYPEFVSEFSERSANVFAVITNDGWFDNTSGPYQLMQYTVLRAVENRKAVARCANNGISCFIDKHGRVSQQTKFGTRAWITGTVELNDEGTFYSRYGDWFASGCFIYSVVVFVYFVVRRRKTEHD